MSTTDAGDPERDERLRPLSAREAGNAVPSRHEGLPSHLELPVRDWARGYIERDTEQRIALLLEVVLSPKGRIRKTTSPPEDLLDHQGIDLLDAVDLARQIQGAITHRPVNPDAFVPGRGTQAIELKPVSVAPLRQLGRLLDDGGSIYRVELATKPPRLMRRVDHTAQAAFDGVATTPGAEQLLRRAWNRVYSRDENPDGAYLDAVRAVEAVACPLVLPKSSRATLSAVTKHLADAPGKWDLRLTKAGDGTVEPLIAMFDRLWHGNLKSRHGSPDYREVTIEEARAAVHLAVVLVQWLNDGVLRSRATPETP